MAGRLPFDANQGHGANSGLTPQMRAALGLPTIEDILFGQQQQRAHQEAQRDLQYRRALYQDQLDQQLQELQMRSNFAQLDDFSELRTRLLLAEQHRQRSEQEQVLLRHALAQQSSAQGTAAAAAGGGGGVPAAAAAAAGGGNSGALHQAFSDAQTAQSLYEERLKLLQEQDQAKRRQEELLLMQVRQAMQDQHHQQSLTARGLSLLPTGELRQAEGQEGEAALVAAALQPRPPDFTLPAPPGLVGLTGLQAVADAAFQEPIPRLGTVSDLVKAASTEEKAFDTAGVLASLKQVEWPDSDDEEAEDLSAKEEPPTTTVLPPEEPAESVSTEVFQSKFPALPCEPLYEEPESKTDEKAEDGQAEGKEQEIEVVESKKPAEKNGKADGSVETVSNVLQYPYPVDSWYPALNSRKRERRQQGETSGEEDFEEDKQLFEETNLRANPRKIRHRLSSEKEPGVIEKIPHCRLHRSRTKYTTVAELLFCFQVTECYPNDIMVNCSVCGTWRHAACGGHYKPISKREGAAESFVAICENCHAEKKYLKENDRGRHFLERQRIEHLRRGLASSAVMRQMAFMKHGGNYKWPLGSVSATHVGGHIRSVQLRHDKSEKQWGELASRLSRRFAASSAKERSRVRTKELERLLVCIEDAEGQTDRHNMLLFLDRDTRRPKPIGFEKDHRNMFDPENSSPNPSGNATKDVTLPCVRAGCSMPRRFDSIFCSDACGLHVLETDLLNAFHEASDIHPSVLRFSY